MTIMSILLWNFFLLIISAFLLHMLIFGVILQYYRVYFYKRQGIRFFPSIFPVIGNIPFLVKTVNKVGKNKQMMKEMVTEAFGDSPPKIYGCCFEQEPIL